MVVCCWNNLLFLQQEPGESYLLEQQTAILQWPLLTLACLATSHSYGQSEWDKHLAKIKGLQHKVQELFQQNVSYGFTLHRLPYSAL